MHDLNRDSENPPAAAVVRWTSLHVESRIARQLASRRGASAVYPHREHDLDAAAGVVGTTLLGGAIWLALALWLL
jgi:cell division protein FtsX